MSRSTEPLADEWPAMREYEDLVNSLDEVVYRFDERGQWSYLSPAWQRTLGWKIEDSLGRAAAKFVHREDRGQVLQAWSEVLKGRQQSYRREVRFRHMRGGERWMLVAARGLRDESGQLRGVTGTLTDITTEKATEAELIAARAAAESANRAKSEFLSTMSHELRTPLNAVIGLSESLLEGGAPFDPERTRRYLDIIHTSGRQLLAQINDILDLARIEAGRVKVNAEIFDARLLCHAALETAQKEIRAKQLQARPQWPAEPVRVNGDERLLGQVMQNLVSNAVKFTPPGGRIGIALERRPEGAIRIVVSDTGIGIAPEKLELLFKPFSQVDSSLGRRFGGTGLGLVLVERIVRLHHGSVRVSSAPGKGSAFTIELPGGAAPAPRSAARAPRARRAVLVDNDPRQHSLLSDYLRRRDFEVISCEDAAAALAAIARSEPGFVVVDAHLPGMSGVELIAQLRSVPAGRDLPILAVTATTGGEESARCRAAGADADLAKPVSLPVFAQHIQHLTGIGV